MSKMPIDAASIFLKVNVDKFFALLEKGSTRDDAARVCFGMSWRSVGYCAFSGHEDATAIIWRARELGRAPNTPRKHPWLPLASGMVRPPKVTYLDKLETRATQLTGFRKQTMEAFAATAKDVATFKTHGYRKRVHPNTNHFMTIEDAELCQ